MYTDIIKENGNVKDMKRKSFIIFVLPYVIFFVLFILYKASIMKDMYMEANIYFVILGISYSICGILFYYLIVLLNTIKKPDVIFIILCLITILIMCFIIWEGMKYQFPIDNFVENSFLIIGIYICKILSVIRDKYLNK